MSEKSDIRKFTEAVSAYTVADEKLQEALKNTTEASQALREILGTLENAAPSFVPDPIEFNPRAFAAIDSDDGTSFRVNAVSAPRNGCKGCVFFFRSYGDSVCTLARHTAHYMDYQVAMIRNVCAACVFHYVGLHAKK